MARRVAAAAAAAGGKPPSAPVHFARPRNVATVPGPFALEHGGVLEGPLSVVWEQWGEPRLPAARTVVVLPSFSHGAQKKHSADCYLSI